MTPRIMAPMAAPIPIPAFAPVERPESDGLDDVDDPADEPLPPFKGIDSTAVLVGMLFAPVPVAPGLASVPPVVVPRVTVDGISPDLKLSWIRGAKSTKLDWTLPLTVRGKVTRLKSL